MYLICLRTVILKMRLQLKVFGLISDRTCKIKIAWSLCCTKITFLCINRIKIKNTLTKQKNHFFVTLQYPIYKYFGTWTIICLILRVYRTCVIVHAYSWHRVITIHRNVYPCALYQTVYTDLLNTLNFTKLPNYWWDWGGIVQLKKLI